MDRWPQEKKANDNAEWKPALARFIPLTIALSALLIYYSTFYKMRPKAHLTIGWIYFIAAWLSLFIINGILSFMFTPGNWLETKGFWSALFNPSFWPSLLFRTAMALILAGIYGLVTASRLQEPNFRQKMVRYCAVWLVAPFVILAPSAWWYLESIPLDAQAMILGQSQDVVTFTRTYLILSPLLCIGGMLAAIRLPQGLQKALAAVILIIGLVYMGSFEYMREIGRRPYVIYGYMYSNGLTRGQVPEVEQQGVLKYAKWSRVKEVTPENLKVAGQELFRLLCISCHSVGGFRNDILIHVKGVNLPNLEQVIYDMGTAYPQMPPFPGTSLERGALARYLGTLGK